jgi:hypothetical protein
LGHRHSIIRADQALGLALALACAAALGGCGAVQFEGKVFDYMGLSGDRVEADVRMSERPPLLLPPNTKTLPQPGNGVVAATARQDWPDDPERVQKRIVAEKKAQQNLEEAKNDPINPYAGKPTLLDKWFGREKTEQVPIADVPEPDPSDRLPGEPTQGVASAPEPLSPHVPHTPVNTGIPTGPTGAETYGRVSNPTESGQRDAGF